MSDPGAYGPLSHRVARRALRRFLAARVPFVRSKLPTHDRGQRLDAATYVLLRDLERIAPFDRDRSVGAVRAEYEELGPILDCTPAPMHAVEERVVEGPCRARIYWPSASAQARPCCLYFHGGGFVVGSPRSHDALVRSLARDTGAIVVSVDYRLAPEHKLPAAHDDALAAYRWTLEHARELGIDAQRIVLAGDSAGGNLALATAISARDLDLPPPRGLVPIYPTTDMTRSFPSHRELAEGYFLTRQMLDWFSERFLVSSAQLRDPRLSPLLVTDLSRLPPTHLVTAGFDPLRDEGEAMATRLRESGVSCTQRCEDSLIHGFVSMTGVLPEAERGVARVAEALRAKLFD